jgi:hypothetical protein
MGIVAGGDAADLDRVGERSNIRRLADLIEHCCCRVSAPCCRHCDLVAIVDKIGRNTVYN